MKPTIKTLIVEHASELAALASHSELTAWAKAHGIDSASGFAGYKKALLSIGVDYEAMRAGKRAEVRHALDAAATKSVTLYVDAKARTGRYGICDADGEPLWHGRFFDEDAGEQSAAEMQAALKAVWLAKKIAEAAGQTAIRLILKVDAEWLTYANAVGAEGDDGKRGGKARRLGEQARKLNVLLTVEWISGANNPADAWTVAHGFKKWSDNDLTRMAQ